MRDLARNPAAPREPAAAHLRTTPAGATTPRVGAALALQARVGNAATARMLARKEAKPDPLAGHRLPKPAPLHLPKQWQNPHLVKSIYPGREAMFREFVALYRELEHGGTVTADVRKRIRDETAAKSGDALVAEVTRVMGLKAVPEWLKAQIWDYAGMRYYADPTTSAGRHGAHKTYYSPARLMYLIVRERGTFAKYRADEQLKADEQYAKAKTEWDKKPAATAAERRARGSAPRKPAQIKQSRFEQAYLEMTDEDAMAFLVKNRFGAGPLTIPDWVWHQIVRLTPLRARYAGADWEDRTKEAPDPDDTFWIKVVTAWKGNERVGKNWGGDTQWRPETLDEQMQVASAMVCNEISEATQGKRGIRLPGGIRLNAEYFANAAVDGAKPGARPEVAGAYFKPLESITDLRPGASLFWINSVWMTPKKGTRFDNSNMVFPIAGVKLPMPFPTEHVADWAAWDRRRKAKEQWDTARAKLTWDPRSKTSTRVPTDAETAKLGPDPGAAGDEPAYTRTELPNDGEVVDGWRYTVAAGKGIMRERQADGAQQWMTWLHQATVLQAMADGRVYLFETRLLDQKDANSGVTGVNQRWFGGKDMRGPWVWVGYMPGKVDAGAARP